MPGSGPGAERRRPAMHAWLVSGTRGRHPTEHRSRLDCFAIAYARPTLTDGCRQTKSLNPNYICFDLLWICSTTCCTTSCTTNSQQITALMYWYKVVTPFTRNRDNRKNVLRTVKTHFFNNFKYFRTIKLIAYHSDHSCSC